MTLVALILYVQSVVSSVFNFTLVLAQFSKNLGWGVMKKQNGTEYCSFISATTSAKENTLCKKTKKNKTKKNILNSNV